MHMRTQNVVKYLKCFTKFQGNLSGQLEVKKENHINTYNCLQMLVLKLDAISFYDKENDFLFPMVRMAYLRILFTVNYSAVK